MTIEYVGGKTHAFPGTTSTTNISLTDLTGGLASAPADGDLVVAVYGIGSQPGFATDISITPDYTEVAEVSAYLGKIYETDLCVAYKRMGASPDTSVTVSGTGDALCAGAVAVHVWRGIDSVSPMDVTRTTATGAGSGNPNPPAITPANADAVILVCGSGGSQDGVVFNTPSDLSNFRRAWQADTIDVVVGIGSHVWTDGAFDPEAWTGNTAFDTESWAAITLALRPAGAGGSGVRRRQQLVIGV